MDVSGCPVAGATDSTAVTPAAPASASNDNDGDGVLNARDRCPNSAGPASNGGCPVIKAEVRRSLQAATRSIRFESNKAVLLPSSYPTLDALVPVLSQYPDYSLSIAGHTDNKGPAAFNLTLSRERAAAARRYLVEKGVAESRIDTRGYGTRYPIVSNATEAGRARNRRVEFDLFVSSGTNSAQLKYGAAPTKAPAKPAKATPARKKPATKQLVRPRKVAPKAGTRKVTRSASAPQKPAAPKPAVRRAAPPRS
ncbi:OmpA family protein [Hymenobacter cellulosivorans]|uniref:OmpA family protein n=1 Tax=Hymenobacter cellulosivorans TaxID=2932249 RepID=A0ABY4FGF9_9BACT|nr:OmpA family protein [Hymenobacter cellulosivorans]